MKWIGRLALLVLVCRSTECPAPDAAAVPVLSVTGAVNPGTGDYLMEAIDAADRAGAPYLVVTLDTSGGLLTTTREIVKKMLGARTPIVAFVGPGSARAVSAGALIAMAADVVAVSPGAAIGAAPATTLGSESEEALREKLMNDSAAMAESLARAKGRNPRWAIQAVRSSEPIPAEIALKQGIADLLADDLAALLGKLPGHTLRLAKGETRMLPVGAPSVRHVEMTLNQELVARIADPNLAYVILTIGGLLLWVELTQLLVFPGILGAFCLLVSLVLFQMLPVSYGALALLVVGMGLLIAEVFVPAYGLFGLAGLGAFIFGSLFLMDTAVPEFQVALGLILPMAAVLAAVGIYLGNRVAKSRGLRARSGLEALVGEYGEIREPVGAKTGKVFVQGELWAAITEAADTLAEGQLVIVKGVRGMRLLVEPRPGNA